MPKGEGTMGTPDSSNPEDNEWRDTENFRAGKNIMMGLASHKDYAGGHVRMGRSW